MSHETTRGILTGAALPEEQPAHFEPVINLKAAEALSVTIPTRLPVRAHGLIP